MDGGMKSNHSLGHRFSCGIGVKAAIDLRGFLDQGRQPKWVGSGAGGRDTAVLGIEREATDGVDGRFTEDDLVTRSGGDGEKAEIFAGARGHATPEARTGSTQLGADGKVIFSQEEENRVGPVVGVESGGLDQALDQGGGQSALSSEIVSDAREAVGIGRRQSPVGLDRRRRRRRGGGWNMAFQPMESLLETTAVQMDHQVDGAAAAHPAVPVDEFGAVDREDSLEGMPLVWVGVIELSSREAEDRFQREGAKPVSPLADRLRGHGPD